MLAARTHRYLSPTLQADANGVVSWVHSVALVAAPALAKMPALASAAATETPQPQPLQTLGTSGMIVTAQNLDSLRVGFKSAFMGAFDTAKSYKSIVAMEVNSTHAEESYGWFGSFPNLREWIGPRVLHALTAHGYTIKNRAFEVTVSIPRTAIEDDTVGLFSPAFQEMGRKAKEHPDVLLFELLSGGFSTNCYDGQYFFDADHPVKDALGAAQSVSNYQSGAGEPWFLLDCSRAVRPLVWQERIPYTFTQLTDERDPHVFFNDEYIYGTRARVNAGFGLWQLAYGSKAALDATNLRAAYTAMTNITDDSGKKLGIRPTHIVVGSGNYFPARDLILSDTIGGTTNTNRNLVEIIAPSQL